MMRNATTRDLNEADRKELARLDAEWDALNQTMFAMQTNTIDSRTYSQSLLIYVEIGKIKIRQEEIEASIREILGLD